MFHFATSTLTHLLTTYGYWAVLLFVTIESTGIPFPGETMLLVAAIYAGMTHLLLIPLVIVVVIIIAFLLFLRRNEHRLEDEAERALPGSLDEYQPGGVRDKQPV